MTKRAPGEPHDACTCGHDWIQHEDAGDGKCASWRCVCTKYKSVSEQRQEHYPGEK